jgi:hypothetical protein
LKVEVAHFVDCVLNNKQPITDGRAGLRTVRILEAADASLKSGQPQQLNIAAQYSGGVNLDFSPSQVHTPSQTFSSQTFPNLLPSSGIN